MKVDMINPKSINRPSGYTHGVVVEGGRIFFIAGQVAWDEHGKCVAPGDIVKQFRQVLKNLKACCDEVDCKMTDLVKLNVYVTDKADYMAHNAELHAIWLEYFGKFFPPLTLVEITKLWDDENIVEIEGIAILK